MQSRLVAFRIFRRSATVAVLSGRTLEFVDIQHLSNTPKVALETQERFIGWVLENFRPQIVVLATGADEDEDRPRAQMLTQAAEQKLLESGVPVWKVGDPELLESFAIPALTQKHELRAIARSMWPYVAAQHEPALDAALAGLYVQVERILSSGSQN